MIRSDRTLDIVQRRMGIRAWQLQTLHRMRPIDAEEARDRRAGIRLLESNIIGVLQPGQAVACKTGFSDTILVDLSVSIFDHPDAIVYPLETHYEHYITYD